MNSPVYTLYSDGGARGNPGPSAIGCLLTDASGRAVFIISQKIGIGTNNQAEYKALIAGLTQAKKHQVRNLQCFLDSELIVNQLLGVYRVKDADLKILSQKVQDLLTSFDSILIKHIPRSKNAEADSLVNQALDQK